MIILGITAFIQNPAACLLKDGKLVAFAEEERFIRLKSAYGFFPSKAINYCLNEANISPKSVDRIAIGWDSQKYRFRMPLFFLSSWFAYGRKLQGGPISLVLKELLTHEPSAMRYRIKIGLRQLGFKKPLPKIEFIPHHLAHAASSYYASGFDKATILVIDGSGEEKTTTLFSGENGQIRELESANIPHSLGWFYAAFSAYLGFKPYEEDGFLMGLAPYGKGNVEIQKKVNKILTLDKDGFYKVDPAHTLLGLHSFNEHFSDYMVKVFGEPRLRGEPITRRHKDIAFAVQNRLEESVLSLTRRVVNKTGIKNLCLAGGVALNCKMNGVLLRSGLIDKLFIQPVSHDAGSALGAAMIIARAEGDDPSFRMQHTKWGPGFSNKQVEAVLKEGGVKYSTDKDIITRVSKAIAEGKIVGWFQGRMEAGPRALGGRSILANPVIKGINDYVNNRVKHRDSWRPFCPSFSERVAGDFYDGNEESDFMIVAYSINPKLREKIPAVIHVDGSARPQTVRKKIDSKYYHLIEEVGEHTGVAAVLNTSFNVKGEPIICNPAEALRCFYSTGIDCLALGDYWLEKG